MTWYMLVLQLPFKLSKSLCNTGVDRTYSLLNNCIAKLKLNFQLSKAWVALSLHGGGWVVRLCVTLCSSALEQATDKCNTVLDRGQVAHEDPTIKIQIVHNWNQERPLCLQKDTYWLKTLRMKVLSCNLEERIKFT